MIRAGFLRAVRVRTTFAPMWVVRWVRRFALVAMIFALPMSQQVVAHVASIVVAESGDDCGDDCNCRDCCPGGCTHCVNCAAPVTLPNALGGELSSVPNASVAVTERCEGRPSSGYGTPPFRPPTA